MKSRSKVRLLPIKGYLLLNLVVLGTMAAIYMASMAYAEASNFLSVGLLPILGTCYIAFLVVCILDAMVDRLTAASHDKRIRAAEKTQASTVKEVPRGID